MTTKKSTPSAAKARKPDPLTPQQLSDLRRVVKTRRVEPHQVPTLHAIGLVNLAPLRLDEERPAHSRVALRYDDQAILQCLRKAWTEVRRQDRHATGLSLLRYAGVRHSDWPAGLTIVRRFGGWAQACLRAGVPTGLVYTRRDLVSRFDHATLRKDLVRYVTESAQQGQPCSIRRFDAWLKAAGSDYGAGAARARYRFLLDDLQEAYLAYIRQVIADHRAAAGTRQRRSPSLAGTPAGNRPRRTPGGTKQTNKTNKTKEK